MKKFYITTAVPYVNNPPHLGFALEIIQADVIARYHRLLGEDVFFLTGADEHGVKNVKAAEKQGISPRELVDRNSQKFIELDKILNISNDDFIRTTDRERHWPSVKKVWQGLQDSGDLYLRKYRGLYCSGCEAFITKKDLINGKCSLHGKEPEIIEEENYFFRLSRYGREIKKVIEKEDLKIIPKSRAKEILNFIDDGLEDISFSRPRSDLKWGIPVPGDGTQTIYVWADALTNYISALGYGSEGKLFRKYWPADVHCVGKDITRFHAIYWPAILLSLRLPLPKTLFVHGFVTVDGQKMSKSLGNVIDPLELAQKYGPEPVRYFLLREISPTEDGDFTYQKFEERYNADLAKGLGNLVARVLTLATKLKVKSMPRREPKVLLRGEKFKVKVKNLKLDKAIKQTEQDTKNALENFLFNDALGAIWSLISFCDKYIEQEKPWRAGGKQEEVTRDLLVALANIAELLRSFLPETSEKILEQIRDRKSVPLFPRLK